MFYYVPMSTLYEILLVIALMLPIAVNLNPQEIKDGGEKDTLLSEIAANINDYKSRTITLRLRLKHVDRIFEKIIFYDKKNHDIEFDISSREIKKRLAPDMLNLHEGMDYNVTFVVRNVGNLGGIIAELKGFKPVILDAVPGSRG
jgi:hypothetical protein